MRLSRLFGLLLVGLGVVAVGVAQLAGAAPEILPSEAKVRTNTGKSVGSTSFRTLGGLLLECLTAPAEGTEEEKGKPLGLFHIKFEDCTSEQGGVKVKCTGLGDATAGVLLALGKWHLWYDSLTTLGVATVLLLEPVHLACGGLLLIVMTGNLICLDLEPTVSRVTHTFHCNQTGGDPEETDYWNEAGALETAKLNWSVNGGAGESMGVLALFEVTGTVATFADKI